MTKLNYKNKSAKREAAILEAACHVVREKGFHLTRMADIAKEAGVSYGLAYHYFKNKDDLFDALVLKWWTAIFKALNDLQTAGGNTRHKLQSIASYFLNYYENQPDMLHFFISEISRSTSNLNSQRLQSFKQFFKQVEEIIKTGQSNGEIRKDIKARHLCYLFLGGLETIISAMVFENQPISGTRQKNRILNSLLKAYFDGAGK